MNWHPDIEKLKPLIVYTWWQDNDHFTVWGKAENGEPYTVTMQKVSNGVPFEVRKQRALRACANTIWLVQHHGERTLRRVHVAALFPLLPDNCSYPIRHLEHD